MRVAGFVWRSLRRGGKWLLATIGLLLLVAGALDLVGVTVSWKVADWPAWLVVQLVCAVFLITFTVGAYREWDNADRALVSARTQQPQSTPTDTPRPRRGGSADDVAFQAPDDAELEIYGREEIHPFEWKANLLELRVTVHNLTGKIKHLASPFTWTIDGVEEDVGEAVDIFPRADIAVGRELHALELRRPPLVSMIPAGDTVTGWVFTALRHEPWGGVGGYTFTVEDELGTQYRLRKERRGGRQSG